MSQLLLCGAMTIIGVCMVLVTLLEGNRISTSIQGSFLSTVLQILGMLSVSVGVSFVAGYFA